MKHYWHGDKKREVENSVDDKIQGVDDDDKKKTGVNNIIAQSRCWWWRCQKKTGVYDIIGQFKAPYKLSGTCPPLGATGHKTK